MITRKVKLPLVGGLDLVYIHKPYPLSHTGLHSHCPQKPQPHTPRRDQKHFFSVERQFLKKLWFGCRTTHIELSKAFQSSLYTLENM